MGRRNKLGFKEPYRTLAIYLEVLSIGNKEVDVENFLYYHKEFPKVHKNNIKNSLDVLLSAGVVEYEERNSILYVTKVKKDLPSVLGILSKRNLSTYRLMEKKLNIKPGEYDLNEIYKEYNLKGNACPILDAFFFNRAKYDSKRKKIIVY